MTNASISVVVPVFRSGATLPALYARLEPVLSACASDWEIILVDDASNDGTFGAMAELHQRDSRVKLVRFSRNMGQHNAVLCGIGRSRGDYVVTLDDDLQNPPEEIPRFIAKIDEGFDLVIGRIDGGKKHALHRNLSSGLLQLLVTRVIGKPSHISLSSYRCMTRRAADAMAEYAGAHVYMPAVMFNAVPIERIDNLLVAHHERQHGRSTYTLRKLVRLASYLLINHSSTPLRMVTMWGLLLSIISLVFAGYVVLDVLANGSTVAGWPSLVVLISFLSGNIMFCMGVLGEYIGRLVQASGASPFPVFEERL
ncbi:glycosyltransferase [Lysobacter sp. F6437]|uniref:glycosyltransferase n=1 Tax=Lysobacter sp. F6437 TaxID=3459296 RepID=UPI00403DA4C5